MKGTAAGNAAELPIHRVDVVEPGVPARRRHIRCEIGENLQFDTAGLEAYCFANWDARVFDALVLAAAIQFCDHTKTRPSTRWGREIILRIPVQGALGPVLVPVGQAYEDYRNHPLFADRMEGFLSALFGHDIRYTYPRLWRTKAETLAAFTAVCPDGTNWAQTRSCWQGQRQVSLFEKWRQCGICAACMLRRMSVHAMGGAEGKATYIWEDLSAVRYEDGAAAGFRKTKPQGALYEYAIAGTLHLDHLAGLLHSPANQVLLDRQVFQLSRSLGVAEQETQQKLERLLTQHAKEWNDFVGSLGPRSFVAQWALGGP